MDDLRKTKEVTKLGVLKRKKVPCFGTYDPRSRLVGILGFLVTISRPVKSV